MFHVQVDKGPQLWIDGIQPMGGESSPSIQPMVTLLRYTIDLLFLPLPLVSEFLLNYSAENILFNMYIMFIACK